MVGLTLFQNILNSFQARNHEQRGKLVPLKSVHFLDICTSPRHFAHHHTTRQKRDVHDSKFRGESGGQNHRAAE